MIRIIVGPPAAGKTTYVHAHKKEGDAVIDFDTLATALGSPTAYQAPRPIKEVTFAARTAAIARIFEGVETDAWIIQSNPDKGLIEKWGSQGARFIIVDPGEEVTLAQADGRPEPTEDLIRAWYENPPTIPPAWIEKPEKKGAAMRVKTVAADISAADLKEGEFIAYASTFDRVPDSWGDIVAPGAFLESLAAWEKSGNVIPILYGHRMDDPDYNIGAVVSAVEDERGLKIHGCLDLDSPKGAQTYRLIKGRRLTQLSFAFDVLEDGLTEYEEGKSAWELRKVKIYEVSLVPIGANQHTEIIAVKEAAEVVAASVKAGRELSTKNAELLSTALTTLNEAASNIKAALATTGQVKPEGEEASGNQKAPNPDVDPGQKENPSAESLNLMIALSLAGIPADERK